MRKLNASIVLGIIIAIIGAVGVIAYGRMVNQRVVSGRQSETVLVADDTLTSGMSVSSLKGLVHAVQVPSAFAVDGAVTSLNDVPAGRVLTTTVPKGGQLSRQSFGDPAVAGRLNPAPGDVAIAVQTDLSPGVAKYLTTGQLVDVFVTYNNISVGGKTSLASSRTKLFITGVKVLAVNAATPATTSTKSGSSPLGGGSSNSSSPVPGDKVLVVLDMSPTQAERLVNAQTLGSIYLAFTPTGGDRTPIGVTPQDVIRSNR